MTDPRRPAGLIVAAGWAVGWLTGHTIRRLFTARPARTLPVYQQQPRRETREQWVERLRQVAVEDGLRAAGYRPVSRRIEHRW